MEKYERLPNNATLIFSNLDYIFLTQSLGATYFNVQIRCLSDLWFFPGKGRCKEIYDIATGDLTSDTRTDVLRRNDVGHFSLLFHVSGEKRDSLQMNRSQEMLIRQYKCVLQRPYVRSGRNLISGHKVGS